MRSLSRRDLQVATVIAVVMATVGELLGVLVAVAEPHLAVGFYSEQSGGYYLSTAVEEDHAVVGGDFVLLAVLAVAGVLAGLAALRLRDRAPGGAVVGLLVGGVAGGLLAMAVAHAVVHPDYAHLTVGGIGQVRPYLRGRVDAAMLPAASLLTFLAGNARFLWRTRSRPQAPVSSGTAARG